MRGGTGWLSTRQVRGPVVLGKLWSDIPALGVPLGSGDTVYEVLAPDLDPENGLSATEVVVVVVRLRAMPAGRSWPACSGCIRKPSLRHARIWPATATRPPGSGPTSRSSSPRAWQPNTTCAASTGSTSRT